MRKPKNYPRACMGSPEDFGGEKNQLSEVPESLGLLRSWGNSTPLWQPSVPVLSGTV